MDTQRIDPKIISIVVIVLIAVAAGAVYATGNKNGTAPADTTSSSQTTTEKDPSTAAASYKDGTYTETGTYTTPGGTESITVTVTLASGKVAAVDATGNAKSGEALEYQSDFLSGYKSNVVGKSIDAVSLSRVAGSSLTSNGFNRAITAIKNDAAS